MEVPLLKIFDRVVPDSLKFHVKEVLRSFEYYRYNLFSNGREIFSRLDVETNTDCNRTCKICPCSLSPRPCGHMKMEQYETLLEQLSEMNFRGRLSPVFYNEPLLDERLPDLMRIAKAVLPEARLTLYTNGSLLTGGLVTTLLDSGLDGFMISQYEENLPRDDLSGLFSELPPSIKKKIRYRVLSDDLPLSTRGGLVEVRRPIRKRFCFQASTDAIIDYQGNVVLCCNDFNTEYIFGNIEDRHILDIWNRPEFKKVRKQLRRGDFREEICKACSGKS